MSIPSAHPYPQAVTAAASITILPDPRPAGAPQGQWWPPVALDPTWMRQNATAADLLHIHFGTESFTAEHLAECLRAAREIGWPTVFTVHDLEHPQLDDQGAYRAQLDVLIPGADALITLTEGAAHEIERRWGRTAYVAAHPAVLSVDAEIAQPETSRSLRVGMHLKDLRTNVDGVAMVTALCGAIDHLIGAGRDVTAEVRMHTTVRDVAARDAIRDLVHTTDGVSLVEHDRFDDPELASTLAGLDVCVLPYHHGTHSGWLELCWDLGVGIAAPDVGFYSEQHIDGSVASFTPDTAGSSLADAIGAVLDSPLATRPGSPDRADEILRRRAVRTTELETLTEMHASLYRDLVHPKSLAHGRHS